MTMHVCDALGHFVSDPCSESGIIFRPDHLLLCGGRGLGGPDGASDGTKSMI